MTLSCRLALLKAEPLLVAHFQQLQDRVQANDESAWPEFLQTLHLLVDLQSALAPERVGAMLTTAEMATRFGISPKTLLKRKNRGEIEPALQHGHLIRWTGRETLSSGVEWIAQRKGDPRTRTTRSPVPTAVRRCTGPGDQRTAVAHGPSHLQSSR